MLRKADRPRPAAEPVHDEPGYSTAERAIRRPEPLESRVIGSEPITTTSAATRGPA